MVFTCKFFKDLSGKEVYEILKLRAQVFVVEQNCVFLDSDGLDCHPEVAHLCAWDQHGDLMAYARLLPPGLVVPDHVVIGRVVTAPQYRQQGRGKRLMQEALEASKRLWPQFPVYLAAQAHLQNFYALFGFSAVGERFVEDGIDHIGMVHP